MSVRGFRLNGVVHKYAYDALDNKPTPDTTLTESGKPADSKAVGDAISEVRQAVGSPLVAATAAAMTDTSKIYVYTGSESGYTSGNWYYYNGTSWVSGGVYNSSAVETDKTLSVSDKAADAKTVGDRIAEVAAAAGTVDAIAPEFELKAYSKGDLVFYENVLYQANKNTYPVDIEGQPVWPSASFDEVTIDDVINGDIVNLIARRFINNEGWIREVGTYVVYGDKLYRVTEANSDTIWNASKYVEVASIGAEINNIKSSVSALGTTVSNLSSELSEAKDDITELKNDLIQLEDGTGIMVQEGYFPNAWKSINNSFGEYQFKFIADNNTFITNRDKTSAGTTTIGIGLADSGLSLADRIVPIADYPVCKIHIESNVPSEGNLQYRVFTYQSDGTTLNHNYYVSVPANGDYTEDIAKKIADNRWSNDVYWTISSVAAGSATYTEPPFLHVTYQGFYTQEQIEHYNLAVTIADINSKLDPIASTAITAIGESNLADETKTIFGQLDGTGNVVATSEQNQHITTDYIPVTSGVQYMLQLWERNGGNFWSRICFYDSSKAFIKRTGFETASGTDHGYMYCIAPLEIESGTAYVRISIVTFGDGKIKFERGNAVSDWTPGLGATINGAVWNDTSAHSILGVIHRGSGEDQVAPENTIAGFIWGKNAGFDFAETDIRYTSDGVAVLLHDASINRTARNSDGSAISGTVNIADITYEQALTYDFGIYKGQDYAGTKIPTLEEFIVLCKNIGLHPFLELKAFRNADIDIPNIISMLDGYGMLNHVSWVASSYDWLFAIRRIYPHADLALLTDATYFGRAVATLNALKTPSNRVSMSIISTELTAERIQALKENGILISAYCPNTEAAMLALDESVSIVTSDTLNYETVRKNDILGTT